MRYVIGVLLLFALAQLVLLTQGCTDPYDGPSEGGECPTIAETRCAGQLSQMCSSEQQWETLYDCAELEMACDAEIGECAELDAGEVDTNA